MKWVKGYQNISFPVIYWSIDTKNCCHDFGVYRLHEHVDVSIIWQKSCQCCWIVIEISMKIFIIQEKNDYFFTLFQSIFSVMDVYSRKKHVQVAAANTEIPQSSDPNPTMHHSEQKFANFCFEWCIVWHVRLLYSLRLWHIFCQLCFQYILNDKQNTITSKEGKNVWR